MRRLPALLLAAAAPCLAAARASAADGPRSAHTATYLPTGRILIAGGVDITNSVPPITETYLNTTEIMHAGTGGSFTTGPNLSVARASHTATVLGNGCVLIAGGVNGGGALNSADIYDPVSNSIVSSPAGMTARYNHTATLLNSGKVLLCGGQTTGGGVLASCDLFTPTGVMGGACGGTFAAGAATMLHQRAGHTAVLLQNGQVWFAGGYDGTGAVVTPTTELYNPTSNGFSSASPMVQARGNHTATMMGDGRIFVAGGYDALNVLANEGILDTTEIYDPVGNDTIPGPTLEARRMMHTSVLSADGSVMLFGGLGNITTTYITPTLTFASGQIVTSNASGNTATVGSGMPTPNAPLAFTLSQPVVGTISSGTVMFSQPTATFPWGTIAFLDPTDEQLEGFQATCPSGSPCGTVNIPALAFPNLGGTAVFTDVTVVPTGKGSGGTLTTSGGNVTGTDVDFFTTLAAPSGLNGATITGAIGPVTGSITSTSYTVNITAGSISVPGEVVSGSGSIAWTADATGLQGTITYNTVPIVNVGGGITAGTFNFTPSPMNSGQTSAALTSGTASFTTTLSLPADLAGCTITGTLTITAGTLTATDYSGTLTGGSFPFTGAVNASGQLVNVSVTASNLTGTLTYTGTSGSLTSGAAGNANGAVLSAVGGNITYTATNLVPTSAAAVALSGNLVYTASNVNIAGGSMVVNLSTVVVDGMIFGQAEFYNPVANSVSFQPPQGSVSASPSIEAIGPTATLLPNNDVFVAGGSDCDPLSMPLCSNISSAGNHLLPPDRYNLFLLENSNFSGSAKLNTARALHTATQLPDGTILVAGGTNGTNLLGTAEIFNPVAGTFTPTPGSMSNVRDLHTATLMTNGRVLIAGGSSTNALSTGPISSSDIYYPDTQLFIPTTPMSTARSNHTATLMPNGLVTVVGGFGPGNVITGTAEAYNPELSTWTEVTPIPSPRAQHTATLLKDGRLLIVGGIDSSGVLSSVYAFTPGAPGTPGSWSGVASLPVGLRGHTATLLSDGNVLVVGGDNGNGETNGSYLYNPVANAWTTLPPIGYPRFDHAANLLPDGSVMISGGATKSGVIPNENEVYHVDGSSWVTGNIFSLGPRAFHTMTLAPNGYLYAIGGSNGLVGGAGTSYYSSSEAGYFTFAPDQYSRNTPPSARQSTFTVTNGVTSLQLSESLVLSGNRFRGGTEASGGGSASANSSFNSPHLLLQRTDASDFVDDLTTAVFLAAPPNDVSLTAALPASQALLPDGWYNIRVGINGVYSNGTLVQVGPVKPTAAPTSIAGTALGVSSIVWTWASVAGVDGYNVYQATGGVFLGTAAATGSPYFVQTGLAANARSQVIVAGYTLSGDGPSGFSPFVTVNQTLAITLVGCGANSTGDSTTSIPWSWNSTNNNATYTVYNSSTGVAISGGLSNTVFEDVGLATNTARSIYVSAVANGQVELSPTATCYTQAAVPLPVAPVLTSTETTSVSLAWLSNSNPNGTLYQIYFDSYVSSTTGAASLTVTTITTPAQTANIMGQYINGLAPSSYYSASVVALNGAGSATAPLLAGTTFTLPAAPQPLTVLGTTPASIYGTWATNTVSTMTYYQLTYSNDNFTTAFSTAIAFSSLYNGSTFTIAGLTTSTSYYLRLTAENPFGQQSQQATAIGYTDNGGAPAGSLAGVLTALGVSEFSGSLAGGRMVDLRSPGGAFTTDTFVTISSYSLTDPGHVACPNALPGLGGAGVAVSIIDSPANQPSRPLFLTLSYSPAEIGAATLGEVALARYDPGSGTCVPLSTAFNTTADTFLAELNHFSLYQLVSVPVYTSAASARVYPNPYHAATDGYVTIDQIPADSRVRVFTLRGEKILDTAPNAAGIVNWGGDNGSGRAIASGLYLVEIEANGTKNILKLAVIR